MQFLDSLQQHASRFRCGWRTRTRLILPLLFGDRSNSSSQSCTNMGLTSASGVCCHRGRMYLFRITWSVSTRRNLPVTFKFVGGRRPVSYTRSVFTSSASQFPRPSASSRLAAVAPTITRQGVTRRVSAVEFGVILTDIHGNGRVTVVVGPTASGTYHLEFDARNGAGCGERRWG